MMTAPAKPRKKILLVEDEPGVAQLFMSLLTQRWPDVLRAWNGQEGLELAQRERPDVILTDMRMPLMNGLELLEALRDDPRTADIPVVILTSSEFDAQTKGLCLKVPSVRAFLSKSCGPEALWETLTHILSS